MTRLEKIKLAATIVSGLLLAIALTFLTEYWWPACVPSFWGG